MVSDVKAHMSQKVHECAKEIVAGLHTSIAAAMAKHYITHLGKKPVTEAMALYQPHAAALRDRLLPPAPAATQTPENHTGKRKRTATPPATPPTPAPTPARCTRRGCGKCRRWPGS